MSLKFDRLLLAAEERITKDIRPGSRRPSGLPDRPGEEGETQVSGADVPEGPRTGKAGYMPIEILRPPLPNRGLTTWLRVEPKEKLKPTDSE